MYRAAVRDGNDIEWQCILCEHPNADSTMEQQEDMSLPDAESTRVEDMSNTEPDPSLNSTEESSLQDPAPAEQSSSFTVTYEIVEQSSKRGHPKLIDNQGYCYSIQRRRGVVTDWQCSVRPKVNPCRASVRQCADQFQCGHHIHNHQAQVGALITAKITSHVKAKAVEDILKPHTLTAQQLPKTTLH